MMSFPTGSAPAIGRQVSVDSSNKGSATVVNTINALIAQAGANKCDVIAKAVLGGVSKGFVYDLASNTFIPDERLEGRGAAAHRAAHPAPPPPTGHGRPGRR